MLDNLAKRFQTFVLVLLVVLLSLVFVLQFGGPQAQGCTEGGGSYAAKVYGKVITEGDFEAAYRLGNFHRRPIESQKSMELKEHVLAGLVERALLAREARDLGYQVEEAEVMRNLLENGTVYLSLGSDAPAMLPRGEISITGGDELDKDRAKAIIQNGLRRSVAEFTEAQVEEYLAARMRETLRASVTVSPREVWDQYVRDEENANIEYVRFSPRFYQSQVEPTDADITKWMKANKPEVDAEYKANKHKYTDLPEQVHARHILLKVPSEAGEEKKAEVRKEAEGLLAKLASGASFAELAKEHSEDPGSARKGGDLGWNEKGRMVEPFDETQFSLEPGEVSGIVETQFGFHIIEVLGKREGDVPPKEAKREIAERLHRDAKAEELAKEAATEALAKLNEGLEADALDQWLRERRGAAPAPATEGEGEQTEGEQAEGEGEQEPAEPAEEEDPLAPKVRESGEFGRGDTPITGLAPGPLVSAVFEQGKDMPDEPLKLGSDFVVYRVTERSEATRENFDDEARASIMRRLLSGKQREAVQVYVRQLRDEAEAEGSIRINEAVLSYGSEGSTDDAS